jgi:hypothetical protein
MSSFGKRVDGPGGRRRTNRNSVRLLGSATTLQGSRSVLVEDLCPTGAKLTGRGLPPTGKEVLVRAGNLKAFGRVAWVESDQCGVVFETAPDGLC